jgi:hypothetical protein
MKQILTLFILLSVVQTHADAQLKGLLNKAKDAIGGKSVSLSNEDIVAGLKEALAVGSQKGANSLSQVDGFFANAALKILLPPEAEKVESTLRKVGLGKQVDDAILSMNRAAEDACKSAAPIFGNAIKQMSFQDALGILKGGDTAATGYLRGKTSTELTNAFRPVIQQSLEKVNATKYWNTLISSYNKINILGKKNQPRSQRLCYRKSPGRYFLPGSRGGKEYQKRPFGENFGDFEESFRKVRW